MRSGTENVPGIVGMGQAVQEAAEELTGHSAYVQKLKLYLWERFRKKSQRYGQMALYPRRERRMFSM